MVAPAPNPLPPSAPRAHSARVGGRPQQHCQQRPPAAMKIPRSASASAIPSVNARVWASAGTANVLMMITNTNRLSTDRLFSTT